MKTYKVIWEVNVSADSPEEAAKRARLVQMNPKSWLTIFKVRCGRKKFNVNLYGNEEENR